MKREVKQKVHYFKQSTDKTLVSFIQIEVWVVEGRLLKVQ